ncbi:MAG TPA: DUF692 domain-containing protein [Pyrinomonadaceae bacterium]|nr:DUF692 domain-containing protein [Pyrinomonadaceae bacterium]
MAAEVKAGAAASLGGLPVLGVGLGFREPFRGDLFMNRGGVDFLEITAEHYLDATAEKERELNLLAEHFTLIPHGLGLSLGSAEGVDREHLRKLAKLIRRLSPPWWSEHASFTRAGGIDIGHLTPTVFTREAAEVFARNLSVVRGEIEAPLILENITYALTVPGGEMTEADFICEVLGRTGCGLLLDVTNLHINSVNHGYDWRAFLDRLPAESVVQLHFVGGHWHHGMLVDSHSHPTPEEVWEVMGEALARFPVRGVVLERDENLPPFAEILSELGRARETWRQHGRWD